MWYKDMEFRADQEDVKFNQTRTESKSFKTKADIESTLKNAYRSRTLVIADAEADSPATCLPEFPTSK